MISSDFEYYKPENFQEAFDLMARLKSDQVAALYYAGGTEVVSSLRKGTLKTQAVIDLKGIEEMSQVVVDGGQVFIGANVPLNALIACESLKFMKAVLEKIADHTIRNTLTLGGNVCGKLPFREAVLPLLASDASVVMVGEDGLYEKKLRECFDKRLKLTGSEFVYGFKLDVEKDLALCSERVEADIAVDYPIVHLVGAKTREGLFIGVSGFASFPVYHLIENEMIALWESPKSELVKRFEKEAKTDERSSASYRVHLMTVLIDKMLGGFYND